MKIYMTDKNGLKKIVDLIKSANPPDGMSKSDFLNELKKILKDEMLYFENGEYVKRA